MHLLKALEKHLPCAKILLEEAPQSTLEDRAGELWAGIDPEKYEAFCVYGLSAPFYELARGWLDENQKRRLIFIEEKPEALSQLLQNEDAILLLNDLRVKIFFLESPLQVEPVARKAAWCTVSQETAILLLRSGGWGAEFKHHLEHYQLGAHLTLSDAADWGVSFMENCRSALHLPHRDGLSLRGKFAGIPALIMGAGPSMEKWEGAEEFARKGLIFAGGSALNILDAEPHFAASIDKEAPYRQFKMHPYSETPFCFQSRMNRENRALVHGPALLFPDPAAPWINWINGQEEGFESGWTVGNFLTSLALFLGCNPILLAGMDLCYGGEQKYAHLDASFGSGLIQVGSNWTQRDWLMAARWTEELAAKHPETQFLHVTEGSICNLKLDPKAIERLPRLKQDLRKQVHEAIQEIPLMDASRLEEWEGSLYRCKLNADSFEHDEEEIVYQLLLKPLWEIWKPLFERELIYDTRQDKMELNQFLFFQQVLQDHIDEVEL